jgi:phage terminase small subunit
MFPRESGDMPSFHIVHSTPKKQKPVIVPKVLTCDWLTSAEAWEKEKFSNNIVEFIEQTQGLNAYPDMVLIGMLTHQIDLYVECSRQLADKGLEADYNKGVTSGPSLHFSMADKVLNRILQIMKELGLTPGHRVGVVKSVTKESLEVEAFLAVP